MSQANVDYVLKHNPEVSAQKIGIDDVGTDGKSDQQIQDQKYQCQS